MQELWSQIPEFPTYAISTHGRVRNTETYRSLKTSINARGIVKVGLMFGGVQHTRSVAVLVAEAFVPGRSEMMDTPVHIDGDPHNNRRDNLIWRPRWFAFRYHRQFENPINQPPVMDVRTNIVFPSPHEAAMQFGLIAAEIYTQAWNYSSRAETRELFRVAFTGSCGSYVWPG